MRKVFFFIFLFTLLLRGLDQVYAGKVVHTTCFLADQEFRKSQRNRGGGASDEQASFHSFESRNVQQDLICEEIEDENNNDFARKYKLLTGYPSILTQNLSQKHLYGCLRDRLPDCSHLYCKYITQRALRI